MNCRVLLVEGNPDHQPLLSRILGEAGCHVTVAENGRVSVDLARAAGQQGHPFDLILMDMFMPVLDGLEATRMLRSSAVTCPIIAVTAAVLPTERRTCLEAGCSDFLLKPVDRAALIELLAAHLPSATAPG